MEDQFPYHRKLEKKSHPRETVVPIQPSGEGIPLFLISPGAECVSLVRYLGSDQPIYAVRIPEIGGGHPCLEEIAAQLATQIRGVRPKGPYAFAGWCAAGLVGLEIARHLGRAREPIAFAALFDARRIFLPDVNLLRRTWIRSWLFAQRIGFFLARVSADGIQPIKTAIKGRARGIQSVGRRMRGLPSADVMSEGLKHYVPRPWWGRVVHIWAERRPRGRFRDPQFAWGTLSPEGFKFYEVPGDHVSMLEEPAIGRVAMILEKELRRARMVPAVKKALDDSSLRCVQTTPAPLDLFRTGAETDRIQ